MHGDSRRSPIGRPSRSTCSRVRRLSVASLWARVMTPLTEIPDEEKKAIILTVAREVSARLPIGAAGKARFALLVFDAGESPMHISNADREDAIRAYTEVAERLRLEEEHLPDTGRFSISADNPFPFPWPQPVKPNSPTRPQSTPELTGEVAALRPFGDSV